MAYYNEATIRDILLSEIQRYARVLNLNIVFDDPNNNTYAELLQLRNDLANQYKDQSFIRDAIEEYNKQG